MFAQIINANLSSAISNNMSTNFSSINPFGCGDGTCDIVPTQKDYELERERYIATCTDSRDHFITFGLARNRLRADCTAEFDSKTAQLRSQIQEKAYSDLNNVQNAALFSKEIDKQQTIKTIVIISLIIAIIYSIF